jgi:hypothetical protein
VTVEVDPQGQIAELYESNNRIELERASTPP